MTPRMENALQLASKCWAKANETAPEFVERYLECAEELLTQKPIVLGDEFREYCTRKRVYRPKELHPNVWVSGVRALKSLGWVHPLEKVEPTQAHNHMPSVTRWKSMIYGADSQAIRLASALTF
jgi:hypothetical protein